MLIAGIEVTSEFRNSDESAVATSLGRYEKCETAALLPCHRTRLSRNYRQPDRALCSNEGSGARTATGRTPILKAYLCRASAVERATNAEVRP